ncbi:MAG: hypothetical protein MUF34_32570 [Polyangiaceae bacterium]|nr:hypothetical protein [Polyangiaceae bacterium]
MAFRLGFSPRWLGSTSAALAALSLSLAARAAPPTGAPPPEGSSWSSPPGATAAPAPPPPGAPKPKGGAAPKDGATSKKGAPKDGAPAKDGAAPRDEAATPPDGATADTPPSAAGEATKNEAPVVVIVRAEGGTLDAGRVRSEVARELGVPAVAPEKAPAETRGTLTVTWRGATRELVVAYQHPARGALTRVVDAPDDASEVAHTAALLAGNLARDESGELAAPTGGAETAATVTPAASRLAAHFSLFHPISTNRDTPQATVNASFNVIYGRVGGLDGVQLGTVNVVAGAAKGGQFALGWNWVRTTMSGFQGSLFGVNVVGGAADAWQMSPAFNYVGGALGGVQLTLGANVAGDAVRGGQGSFVFNYAGGEVRGAQLSSINVAGDVRGLQAGFVNVAGHVKGVQFGLINVADDVEGVPLGIISVTKSGGVHPMVWASSATLANAGVKFATRYTYTMASLAYHEEANSKLFGGGATLGAQLPFDQTRFSFDLQYLYLYDTGDCVEGSRTRCPLEPPKRDQHLVKARVSAGYRFQPHLGVFLGAGAVLSLRPTPTGPDDQRLYDGDLKVRWRPEVFGGLEF